MEEMIKELDELIAKAKDDMESLQVGSDEWKSASEAYLNLVKARGEYLRVKEEDKTVWSKILKGVEIAGPFVGPVLLGIGKFYEVWARRRTNQEAMYIEEVAAKYIPKTPWNNK